MVPVGTSEAAQALVDRAVEEFGRLDILVNNAGILRDTTLWKMTDDDFDAVITTHLRGTFTCTRAAAVRMREQGEGGRIICVGSPTGQLGNFGQTNYAAAKAGIVGMVRTWAMELARAEITVNAIVPVAATAMTETMPFLKPYIDALKRGEPLPAVRPAAARASARPEDAAGLVAFLASDAAAGHHRPGHRHRRRPAGAVVATRPRSWSSSPTAPAGRPTRSPGCGRTRFAPSQQTVGQQSRSRRSELSSWTSTTLVAIDVHVHVQPTCTATCALDDELHDAAAKYFKGDPYDPTVPEIAADYRERNMAAVIFTVDAEAATGHPALSERGDRRGRRPSTPTCSSRSASIDPARGRAGVRAARRLVEEHGVRGFKFHPSLQGFEPNDRARLPAVRGAAEPRRPGAVPHRPDRHRRGPARRARHQAALLRPDAARRRRRRLPRA